MSQYSWFFVNKNYLLFSILATVLVIPVGFVAADFVFEGQKADLETDGTNSFDAIQGPQGVEMFKNGTDNFALVVAFDDDAVTLINISNPKDLQFQDSLDGSADGTGTSEGRLVLDGASSLAIFSNATGSTGNYAIVTAYLGDGIQIINLKDSKSDTTHALYPTLNASTPWGSPGLAYSGAGGGTGPVLKGLDGAMDVAVFINQTSGFDNKYAIVTGHVGDSIQLIDITDPEVGGALYYNSSGNFMNATADGGTGTHAATDYKGQFGAALAGRLPIDGAFGVDVFYSTSDGNMPYAIVTGQVSDGFQIFSLNDTDKGPVPFANRTSSSTGFELLDSAVGVATWNTTNNDSDRWAIIASNYTDSVTVISLADPTNTTVTDTLVQNSVLSLDGALRVEVAKIGDRHYAFVTSNGTAAAVIADGGSKTHVESGGFQVIDLYDPTNIQPVLSITDNEGDITDLGAAHDVGIFSVDGHTYAAVVSYDDDSITIIQITKDKTGTGSGGTCGVNIDCSAPSVSSNGGGVSVNGASLATEDRYNDVDTVQAKVGQMVTITANVYDSFGGGAVYKSNLYFDIQGSPDWSTASSAIRYDLARDEIEIINDNDNFTADVSSNVVGDIVEVTFKILFTGVMDTSHIAIQNIDDSRNYQMKYFRDALEVTGTPTQTSLTATDDEITQTATASVPAWVKNTAGWWADGAISEGEFVKGVEYLIQQQIIDTDAQTTSSDGTGASIPDWVKNTAGWWADGAISEGEFVNAIEHLVKTGTIIII